MATTHKKLISLAIAAAAIPVSVQGAGFGLNSHSAKSGGTSHAGTAVMAEDPATVFYNPAGMMLSEKTAISASVASISPEFDYSDEGSTTPFGTPYVGSEDTSEEGGVAPSLYYMTPFRDDWALGLSINAPYGTRTEFSNDWIGRYNGTESDIRGVNINPNIAHRINDHVSIGFGLNAQYFDASLSQMVEGQALIGGTPTYDGTNDILTELEGDSWGVGYNAGLLIEPSAGTRVGLAYRSEIKHGIKGRANVTPKGPGAVAITQAISLNSTDATTSVELPESATLSISQTMGDEDRLTILADAQFTRWSRVDTIDVNADDPRLNSSLTLDFQNSWRGSLGATWEQTEQLTLRTGYTFEESAVRNAETRTPRVPDNDRNWLSIGAGYQFSNGMELDASYSHLFIKDTPINNQSSSGTTLDGEFESSADILSVQATYRY